MPEQQMFLDADEIALELGRKDLQIVQLRSALKIAQAKLQEPKRKGKEPTPLKAVESAEGTG